MTIFSGESWLRRYHPAPDGAPLAVCFPHAGGGAAFYHPMSAALSDRVGVLCVQYPGRQDRLAEPPAAEVATAAERVTEALLPWRDSRLVLFGHSMGGIFAFETARCLAREGVALCALFVSAVSAPSRIRPAKGTLDDDEALVAEARALSGQDGEIIADAELLPFVLPALRADYQTMAGYRYDPGAGPLSCPIVAVAGEGDTAAGVDDMRAWAAHTSVAFRLMTYAGGHFYLSRRWKSVADVVASAFSLFP
ncbi:thioesterase II family protein [Nonomuraea sp. NPDC050451]|uniref:thioesterase II family protein n=1 Tax=Nonomuraea sp. NPDC050451 TaxID=3364364 RepID=UPI0037AB2173